MYIDVRMQHSVIIAVISISQDAVKRLHLKTWASVTTTRRLTGTLAISCCTKPSWITPPCRCNAINPMEHDSRLPV